MGQLEQDSSDFVAQVTWMNGFLFFFYLIQAHHDHHFQTKAGSNSSSFLSCGSDVTLVVLEPKPSPPSLSFPLLTFISLETLQQSEFLPLARKHNRTLVSRRTDDSEVLSLISTVTK